MDKLWFFLFVAAFVSPYQCSESEDHHFNDNSEDHISELFGALHVKAYYHRLDDARKPDGAFWGKYHHSLSSFGDGVMDTFMIYAPILFVERHGNAWFNQIIEFYPHRYLQRVISEFEQKDMFKMREQRSLIKYMKKKSVWRKIYDDVIDVPEEEVWAKKDTLRMMAVLFETLWRNIFLRHQRMAEWLMHKSEILKADIIPDKEKWFQEIRDVSDAYFRAASCLFETVRVKQVFTV